MRDGIEFHVLCVSIAAALVFFFLHIHFYQILQLNFIVWLLGIILNRRIAAVDVVVVYIYVYSNNNNNSNRGFSLVWPISSLSICCMLCFVQLSTTVAVITHHHYTIAIPKLNAISYCCALYTAAAWRAFLYKKRCWNFFVAIIKLYPYSNKSVSFLHPVEKEKIQTVSQSISYIRV